MLREVIFAFASKHLDQSLARGLRL